MKMFISKTHIRQNSSDKDERLLLLKKVTQTHIEQAKTESQELFDFEINQPRKTMVFDTRLKTNRKTEAGC